MVVYSFGVSLIKLIPKEGSSDICWVGEYSGSLVTAASVVSLLIDHRSGRSASEGEKIFLVLPINIESVV